MKQSIRGGVFWALIIGAYVASKAIGFSKAYPTQISRDKIAANFGSNTGLSALLGRPHGISTVAGYAQWNTIGVVVIILAIWALLLSTKTFRGAEESGRWEILLAGQTTARKAAVNALVGLLATMLIIYVIVAACFVLIGKDQAVNIGVGPALYFALASVIGGALFISVGALTSQFMPTRSRAAGAAATIFGIFFLVRAMADVTTLNWLYYFTPLGWIEKLQPLYKPQPIWLLPLLALILFLSYLSVYLAGRRDMGDSIIAEKTSVKSSNKLLGSPLSASIRLNRGNTLSWIAAVLLVSIFYGLLTKSAAQAFMQTSAVHGVNKLLQTNSSSASILYLGIVFFLLMVLIMSYSASALGRIREEEAQGYLDNYLVRPVSRYKWLSGRILMVFSIIILMGLASSIGTWAGVFSQHSGASFHSIFIAGFNILPPSFLTVGIGAIALGFMPRLTSILAYGAIGWSFLIQMVSSGINLNHWILDTSIVHHIELAPAVSPNWRSNFIILVLGVSLCVIGAIKFNRRDLANE